VRRIAGRFPGGELLFDVYGPMGIRLQKLVPAVRRSGSTLRWGLADPAVVEGWHDGLTCVEWVRSVELPGIASEPLSVRIPMRVLARLPGFKDVGRILRYRF
jgi:hypothetical protein